MFCWSLKDTSTMVAARIQIHIQTTRPSEHKSDALQHGTPVISTIHTYTNDVITLVTIHEDFFFPPMLLTALFNLLTSVQDTGRDGCQDIVVEVYRLELNSTDFGLWNGRLSVAVDFTEKATGMLSQPRGPPALAQCVRVKSLTIETR